MKVNIKSVNSGVAANDSAKKKSNHAFDDLADRRSAEIVIGLSGPVGSGISYVREALATELESRQYRVVHVKVSELLEKIAATANFSSTEAAGQEASPEFNRIWALQSLGNELRSKFGDDVGAQLAMEAIAIHRTAEHANVEIPDIVPDRVAYIIDQLKNPKEVALLRAVYKNIFFMIGVLASYESRKRNLKMSGELAERLMARDRKESDANGQQLEKTLHQADFFISNAHNNYDSRAVALRRFVGLIHGDNGLTPTPKERGMFAAFTAGLRSACLSRQVGAAIMSADGSLISTGCNDVPRAGGGLYEAGSNDQRCFFQNGFCHNDHHKDALKQDISRILVDGGLDVGMANKLADSIKKETRIGSLIEFSRAVHAEMDAIVSVARQGTAKVAGAIMFTTTYPCHNCARHIVAAGIKIVYFIEPYEKSLASDLHNDSITHDPTSEPAWEAFDSAQKVAFIQFEGVSPKKYSEFFQGAARKDLYGKAVKHKPLADKQMNEFLDDYKELETRVISRLHGLAKVPAPEIIPPTTAA
ncbi:anti-phage dCTP deaminase [Xanthomonas campestris]|uniref:anti-phage dCTP deaminase n=1 Tax=Xanthomonas campestris TaxID=339 RepID=UPI0012908976|nr:anti-phage dCTP deaminase [Xanthomonas campestris]